MKIAIISDIHSNLEAFQTVLRDIEDRGITTIYCCGDIVGYNANPNECIELVKKHKIKSILGNHDETAISLRGADWFNPIAKEAIEWQHTHITPKNMAVLIDLPPFLIENDIFICHGSPEDRLIYIFKHDLNDNFIDRLFDIAKTKIIAVGHTHCPFIIFRKGKMLINVGSVGQPRDGNPTCAYAIVDTENLKKSKIIRLEYPIKVVSDKILKAGLPYGLAKRLFKGQ